MYKILIIIILLFFVFYLKNKNSELFINNDNIFTEIPKIIHQTAPSDKSKWHNDWYSCQESWKTHFPDFEYKMWTDEDNLKLIETDYPWFLETYNKYTININRIDIVRYFILYKYGGIYADMDYMCIKNFYNNLPKNKISISESPFKFNEKLQNALMCSPINHPFWMKLIYKSTERLYKNDNIGSVLYIAGPQLISDTYDENKDDINILPFDLYNPDPKTEDYNNNDKLFTKHLGTQTWVGK